VQCWEWNVGDYLYYRGCPDLSCEDLLFSRDPVSESEKL
jgi:hypothetical protein